MKFSQAAQFLAETLPKVSHDYYDTIAKWGDGFLKKTHEFETLGAFQNYIFDWVRSPENDYSSDPNLSRLVMLVSENSGECFNLNETGSPTEDGEADWSKLAQFAIERDLWDYLYEHHISEAFSEEKEPQEVELDLTWIVFDEQYAAAKNGDRKN